MLGSHAPYPLSKIAAAPPTGPVNKKSVRGRGAEAQRVTARLNGFDSESSEAWRRIKSAFGPGVTHGELKSLAQLICAETGLKLDRDASRDNRVLIKWFQENWQQISHVICRIYLCDQHGDKIVYDRNEL
jgi:hypothetical protein